MLKIISITLSTQAFIDNQIDRKIYGDQFRKAKEQSRRELGLDFYNESSDSVKNNQGNKFNDNNLTKFG